MSADALSAPEFFARFPDESACLNQIFKAKWGSSTPCPHCGAFGGWSHIPGTRKFRHSCRRQISVLKDTPFYRSNLTLRQIFYGMLLFSNSSSGVRAAFLRKHLGLGTKAAHRLGNLIRFQMALAQEPTLIGGPGKTIAVDEVYLRYFRGPNSSASEAKIVLGFAFEGTVRCGIISDRQTATLETAILRYIKPGTAIMTDQWTGYRRLGELGFEHRSVNHARGEFWRNGVTTAPIDAFWASLRRTLRLYRQMGAHNAWLYLAEAQFRYNHRAAPRAGFERLIGNWSQAPVEDQLRSVFIWN